MKPRSPTGRGLLAAWVALFAATACVADGAADDAKRREAESLYAKGLRHPSAPKLGHGRYSLAQRMYSDVIAMPRSRPNCGS